MEGYPKLSVATPVFQAEKCLVELHLRLTVVLEKIGQPYEIIMVDDGSTDRSYELIKEIASRDPRVRGYRMSRNFGQHSTLAACLDLVRGDCVIIMDCDLQDPPEEIPKFLIAANEGYDVVLGRREDRRDSIFKKLSSYVFYKILNALTGVQFDRQTSSFSLLHRKVVESLRLLRETPRFYIALVHWVGFKVKRIDVKHGANGERPSAYNLRKLLNLAFDVCVTYSDRPLRFSVKFGFAMSVLSIIIGSTLYVLAIMGHFTVTGWASVMVSLYFLSGLVVANLGIIGIYIGRIMEQQKNRPIYLLAESTDKVVPAQMVA